MFSNKANSIFQDVIATYKVLNSVDQPFHNKYDKSEDLIGHLLYRKCWIDTVQWHLEDIIRDPEIDPIKGMHSATQNIRLLDASLDNDNLNEELPFIWTASLDDDGDELEYIMSFAHPDTGIFALLCSRIL